MEGRVKIYISGPISGTDDYRERFSKAEAILKNKGHIPVNPIYMDAYQEALTYDEIMYFDLDLLSKCDAIVMLKGWRNSMGANREWGYAYAQDLMIFEEGLLNEL